MILFFKQIFQSIIILRILSKHQILTKPGNYNIPKFIQYLGYLICIFLYPSGFFKKNKNNFGERLAACFHDLGPIYIKFGQTLSTRPDLIGTDVSLNLRYLQDKLPPFDIKIVRRKIKENFGKNIEDIFSEFNEIPVAAASIAQVHKAKLKSGEVVAVKILRPNIRNKYEKDIIFLEFVTKILIIFCKKVHRLKPKEIISIFRQSMKFELDLRTEAAAASRVNDNFKNDPTLLIPKIYWKLTSVDIITLEWIDGVSIYDREKIIQLGLNPKKLSAKIAIMFFNQSFRDGFFHADLHPGNILVCPTGKIVLLDFGIVGILPEKDRLAIAEILYAFFKRDYKLIAKIHLDIGYIPKNTNLEHFSQSCRAISEPIIGLAIKEISIGKLLSHLFKVTEDYGMETQPQLLLLQKTMVVVEGIGNSLDKDINMWELSEPWIKKWAAKNLSPEAKILRFAKNFLSRNKII